MTMFPANRIIDADLESARVGSPCAGAWPVSPGRIARPSRLDPAPQSAAFFAPAKDLAWAMPKTSATNSDSAKAILAIRVAISLMALSPSLSNYCRQSM
jgi:hypothetical protein